jgi:hypothetical protein
VTYGPEGDADANPSDVLADGQIGPGMAWHDMLGTVGLKDGANTLAAPLFQWMQPEGTKPGKWLEVYMSSYPPHFGPHFSASE